MLTLIFADNKVEFWDVESGKELTSASTDSPSKEVDGDSPSKAVRKRGNSSGAASNSRATLTSNLTSLKQAVQLKLAGVRDFAISALWCGDGSGNLANYTLVLYGATWICTARPTSASLTKAGDEEGDVEMEDVSNASKLNWVVRTTAKYQPILLVAQAEVGNKQTREAHLVVVERPYFELAKKLPAAFHRGARYGA